MASEYYENVYKDDSIITHLDSGVNFKPLDRDVVNIIEQRPSNEEIKNAAFSMGPF